MRQGQTACLPQRSPSALAARSQVRWRESSSSVSPKWETKNSLIARRTAGENGFSAKSLSVLDRVLRHSCRELSGILFQWRRYDLRCLFATAAKQRVLKIVVPLFSIAVQLCRFVDQQRQAVALPALQ